MNDSKPMNSQQKDAEIADRQERIVMQDNLHPLERTYCFKAEALIAWLIKQWQLGYITSTIEDMEGDEMPDGSGPIEFDGPITDFSSEEWQGKMVEDMAKEIQNLRLRDDGTYEPSDISA